MLRRQQSRGPADIISCWGHCSAYRVIVLLDLMGDASEEVDAVQQPIPQDIVALMHVRSAWSAIAPPDPANHVLPHVVVVGA